MGSRRKRRRKEIAKMPDVVLDRIADDCFNQDEKKEIIRGTVSYEEGRNAYLAGETSYAVPYITGDDRMFWLTGYYDERIVQRLGPGFDNWDGIQRFNTNKGES